MVHRSASTDDKKLQSSLKKLNVNPIPGIEEVCVLLRLCAAFHRPVSGACIFRSIDPAAIANLSSPLAALPPGKHDQG